MPQPRMDDAPQDRVGQHHHDHGHEIESQLGVGQGGEVRDHGQAEDVELSGQADRGDAFGAIGDWHGQRGEPAHLGEHQGHHRKVHAAQPQNRQADQHREQGAKSSGQGQGPPEADIALGDQNGRHIAAYQRVRTLADVDAADIKSQPHTS